MHAAEIYGWSPSAKGSHSARENVEEHELFTKPNTGKVWAAMVITWVDCQTLCNYNIYQEVWYINQIMCMVYRKTKKLHASFYFLFIFHIFFAKVIVLIKEKIAKNHPLKYNLTRMYSTSLLNNIKKYWTVQEVWAKNSTEKCPKVMNLD